MPRWLAVIVSLVLFTVIMLAVRWALYETVPSAVDWAGSRIGMEAVLAIILGIAALCGVLGYLGHRRQAQRDAADG